MKGEEKRRQIRVFTSVPVNFYTEQSAGEWHGQMVDISLSGMRFTSAEDLLIEDNVKVKFMLPNNAHFMFLGKVVTSIEAKGQKIYGINFIRQTPADRINLSDYIMSTKLEQEFWVRGKVGEQSKADTK
jgi:hypothetical protein